MIAHISRARPALAVEYKGSVPSARETIAQGTLEGRPPAKAWRSFAWVPCVPRTSDEVGAQRWFKHTSSHIPILTIYLLPATAQGPELEDRCQDPEPL